MNVEMIPIDRIKVVNARVRNPARFKEIVESIKTLGLKKPIVVRKHRSGDAYDLVCGQGRLEAFIANGEKQVPAIVVQVSTHDLYLMSLAENLARRTRTTLEDARQLLALRERGYSQAEIARKVGMTDGRVSALLKLLTAGEERLLIAVERGDMPLHVALGIAVADDDGAQRALADAYERGELRGQALNKARRLVEVRRLSGKGVGRSHSARERPPTRQDFVRTYRRETQRQELMVKKSQVCEQRLLFIASALKRLFSQREFVQLLRAEKLNQMPKYLADFVGRS